MEYFGILDNTKKDNLKMKIEIESNNIVNSSLKTIVKFVNKQELLGIYGFAPDYITNMGKIRVIMFGKILGSLVVERMYLI